MKKLLIEREKDLLWNDADHGGYREVGSPPHHPRIVKKFWRRFLRATGLTDGEWEYARWLASQWNTCACGSLNDGLPRDSRNLEPVDSKLERLGCKFMDCMGDRDLNEAQNIFVSINNRAARVIKDIDVAFRSA